MFKPSSESLSKHEPASRQYKNKTPPNKLLLNSTKLMTFLSSDATGFHREKGNLNLSLWKMFKPDRNVEVST